MASGKRPLLHLSLFEFAADIFAVVIAYFAIFFMRFHSAGGIALFSKINRLLGVRDTAELDSFYEDFYISSALRIILLITATVCVLYALFDLYSSRRLIRKPMLAWNIITANTIALAAFYVYLYFSRNTFHPRSFFVTVMPANAALCIILRKLLYSALDALRARTGIDIVHAVVVGAGDDARLIRDIIDATHPHGICIKSSLAFDTNVPFEEMLSKIDKLIKVDAADLLITAERGLTVAQIMQILEKCAEHRIPAKILSEKLSVIVNQARIQPDLIRGIPLMHFAAPCYSELRMAFSRVTDIIFSSMMLILLAPLLALIACVIKLTSNGPVLFTQVRIGVNRKPFKMLKFRTMHHRADEMIAQMEEFNESGTGLFKIKADPRMTRVGKVLRRFSLDELPQLVNVLRGDMAVIGPRPLPQRDFDGYYENWHYSRHEGLPGITCLWQVSGRSDLDFHNMCILDVYYLRNRNWALNLKILFRTVQAVLFARGAY